VQWAGHTLTLTVSVKDDAHEVKADVLSIKYGNGQAFRPAHDKLNFDYSLAKDGSIQVLQQIAHANGTIGIARYDAGHGNTTIRIDSLKGGNSHVSVTESGLWLLDFVTSNGSLTMSYLESA
jgi:hypothetical protein